MTTTTTAPTTARNAALNLSKPVPANARVQIVHRGRRFHKVILLDGPTRTPFVIDGRDLAL